MSEFLQKWLPNIKFIASGVLLNLEYTVIAVFFGLIIGSLLAISKVSSSKILVFFADSYTSIFRGTPLMIQLSIIYYVLPGALGIKISVFAAAIISFSLNSGAYVSEIIRGGISSIDKGQFEAGLALGLSKIQVMKDIIFPQGIRRILPALVNEMINMLKETSLISIIGEAEILRRAQMVASEQYNYTIPMLTAAACYYVVILILSKAGMSLEKKLSL